MFILSDLIDLEVVIQKYGIIAYPIIIIFGFLVYYRWLHKEKIEKKIDSLFRKHYKIVYILFLFVFIIAIVYVILSFTGQLPESDSFRIVISPFQKISSSKTLDEYDIVTPEYIKKAIETKTKNIEVKILQPNEAVTNLETAEAISKKYNAHIVLYGKMKSGYLEEKKSIECSVYPSIKLKNRDTILLKNNTQSAIAGLSDFGFQNLSDISNFEGKVDDVVNLILGLETFFSKDYSSAHIYLSNVSKQSLNSDTYLYLADAQFQLNKINESIDSFKNSLKLNPNNSIALWDLGILYHVNKNFNESIECIDKYIVIIPDDPLGWIVNGQNYQNLGDYDNALRNYVKPLEKNASYFPSLIGACQLNILKGNLSEAEKFINQASEVNPNHEDVWALKAEISLRKQNYISSLIFVEQALLINQNNSESWALKGRILSDEGFHNEAIKYYDIATEIRPNFEDAWLNKGLSYAKMGKYVDAINCYKKVIDLNPKNFDAEISLGQAYSRLGEWEKAKSAFDRAIQIDPSQDIIYEENLESLSSLKKYFEDSGQIY